MGKVLKLYVSKKEVFQFEADEKGVILDKNYAKDENRAILIATKRSYDIAINNGIEITNGCLGENIFIDIDLYHLKPTDKIKIGNSIFEVTQNCTMCRSLSKIDSKLPKLLKDDRGIFVKLVGKRDIIKVDDEVVLL